MKYRIQIENGELGETELHAHDIEHAEESARRWVLEGHWGQRGREAFVAFTITDENEVEWVFDQVVNGFAEPDCTDGQAHEWKSPHELVGGSESCPGNFDHGDHQFRVEEVCAHCGRYRTTITPGGPVLEARQILTNDHLPGSQSAAWMRKSKSVPTRAHCVSSMLAMTPTISSSPELPAPPKMQTMNRRKDHNYK